MEQSAGAYLLTTDRARLDIDVIHRFLSEESYWTPGIARAVVARCVANSFCVGVLHGSAQVGFARVVTDYATFGHIMDVFVVREHRGRGLSKRMMQRIASEPALQGFRLWTLGTADAHGLYARFGFGPPVYPERMMEKRRGRIDDC